MKSGDPSLAGLAFPLNVYALALSLEEGHADWLHYGLDWTSGPIGAAQKRASDYLLAKLPASPRSVLEVGIGFGMLARQLRDLGYSYRGISPDIEQVNLARARHPDLDFQCTALQALMQQAQYDVLVFQESAQYIEAGEILRVGRQVLKIGGCVVIADELPLAVVRSVTALPRETGFVVAEMDDVTDRASGSLDYLIETLFRHRVQILKVSSLPSHRLSGLLNVLEQRRLEYRNGAYRYAYVRLDRI